MARMVLKGGPFDGHEVAFLPPDVAAPVQVAWSGWFPWGPTTYVYEWHGEQTTDRGRTDALIYRPALVGDGPVKTYRRLTADEIPYLISEDTEVWADTAALIVEGFDIPAELLWPGV
jgi:hypothetical protein